MKIGWITDPHLDYIPVRNIEAYFKKLSHLDGIVITGDIAEASSLRTCLEVVQRSSKTEIFFVLGNHDYWGSSIRGVSEQAKKLNLPGVFYIDQKRIEFGKSVMVGVNGFYDGRSGNPVDKSRAISNDTENIEELKLATKLQLKIALENLGKEFADQAREIVLHAIEYGARKIYIATHFPPYRAASMYDGRVCDNEHAPYFVNTSLGSVLSEIADSHLDREFVVLCGHSHHEAMVQMHDNLVVMAGMGRYGEIYTKELEIG